MIPLNRLLWGQSHVIDFALECGWLSCNGDRLPDLSWELSFNVFITTKPRLGMEVVTRHNPTDALRRRLAEVGVLTHFDSDPPVAWLISYVPSVSLNDLMDRMRKIVVVGPDQFCEPIVFSE